MEVSIDGNTFQGSGRTKKDAKKNCAIQALKDAFGITYSMGGDPADEETTTWTDGPYDFKMFENVCFKFGFDVDLNGWFNAKLYEIFFVSFDVHYWKEDSLDQP